MKISFLLDPYGDCTVVVPTTGHDERVRFALTQARDYFLVADGPSRNWFEVPQSMKNPIRSVLVTIVDEHESVIEARELTLFVDLPVDLKSKAARAL